MTLGTPGNDVMKRNKNNKIKKTLKIPKSLPINLLRQVITSNISNGFINYKLRIFTNVHTLINQENYHGYGNQHQHSITQCTA